MIIQNQTFKMSCIKIFLVFECRVFVPHCILSHFRTMINMLNKLIGFCQPPPNAFIGQYFYPLRSRTIRELILSQRLTQKMAAFRPLQNYMAQRFKTFLTQTFNTFFLLSFKLFLLKQFPGKFWFFSRKLKKSKESKNP